MKTQKTTTPYGETMMKSDKRKDEEWEKEFLKLYHSHARNEGDFIYFIRSNFISKRELREKLEGMKFREDEEIGVTKINPWNIRYNQAIDNALSLLDTYRPSIDLLSTHAEGEK